MDFGFVQMRLISRVNFHHLLVSPLGFPGSISLFSFNPFWNERDLYQIRSFSTPNRGVYLSFMLSASLFCAAKKFFFQRGKRKGKIMAARKTQGGLCKRGWFFFSVQKGADSFSRSIHHQRTSVKHVDIVGQKVYCMEMR